MHRPKILSAVVNSEAGRHAGREAIRLSLASHAALVLVSVVPAYCGNMSLIHIKNPHQTFSEPHREILAELEKEAGEAGVPVRTVIEGGEPFERIVYLADAENVDLIVIGSGRRSLIERSILGSTVAKVIGYCKRDVLVVSPGSHIDFMRILLAADGSPGSRNAADRAIGLAADYGGELQAVQVLDVPPEYYLHESVMTGMAEKARGELENIRQSAADKGVTVKTIICHGETYQEIVDTARKQPADLIVIGTYGHTGIRRWLMGSVVERVLAHAPCPVMVVH